MRHAGRKRAPGGMALTLDDADRTALRDRLAAILADGGGPESSGRPNDVTRRGEIADMAIDQVLTYAGPDTPAAVVREACIRYCAWLSQSSAVFDQHNVSGADGTALTKLFSHGSGIRASGALPMLAPHRAVRAFEGV